MALSPLGITQSPYYIKGKCFNNCDATLIVGLQKTEMYVCMDQLAKLSEYFRIMFYGHFKTENQKQFEMSDETLQSLISFFNAIDADPAINQITDNSVESLIRLADKLQCDMLKERLKNRIAKEPTSISASTLLSWLVSSVKYNMPEATVNVCLPAVACLPMTTLRSNRTNIGSDLYIKLIEAKVEVFQRGGIPTDTCSVCRKTSRCGPQFTRTNHGMAVLLGGHSRFRECISTLQHETIAYRVVGYTKLYCWC